MWKAIKEIWYRLKVRKYTFKIQGATKKREAIKANQSKDTIKREQYQAKLDNLLKEG